MAGELEDGFSVFIDGKMVAVESTFQDAIATANIRRAGLPSTAKIQVSSANSQVLHGSGATPRRIWNYDTAMDQWVELLR